MRSLRLSVPPFISVGSQFTALIETKMINTLRVKLAASDNVYVTGDKEVHLDATEGVNEVSWTVESKTGRFASLNIEVEGEGLFQAAICKVQ